MFDYRKLAGS
jgi:hypothetical protein